MRRAHWGHRTSAALLLAGCVAAGTPAAANRSADSLASANKGGVAPAKEEPVLADRVVATINGVPVTASQVAFEEAIRGRIRQSAEPQRFGRLLSEDVDALEALLFRNILRQLPEARDLGLVDEGEATERLLTFEDLFPQPAELRRFLELWGLKRGDLLAFLRETVLLDEVIHLNVQVQVSPEEEQAYYEKNKSRVFGDKPFGEVSGYVTRQVYHLKFEAEYNSWRSKLRSAAEKRYIGR